MSWLDLVDQAHFLRSLYPNGGPPLAPVRLHEVTLHQDGPSLTLRFDLATWPAKPPAKWEGSNTVQVCLVATGLDDLRIEGWGLDNVGALSLEKRAEALRILFDGDGTELVAQARFLRVDRVSAYTNDERAG